MSRELVWEVLPLSLSLKQATFACEYENILCIFLNVYETIFSFSIVCIFIFLYILTWKERILFLYTGSFFFTVYTKDAASWIFNENLLYKDVCLQSHGKIFSLLRNDDKNIKFIARLLGHISRYIKRKKRIKSLKRFLI